MKYEPSLGDDTRKYRQRRLPIIWRKLQWHTFMSEKVLGLRMKIESQMRILNSVIQRLTLDLVWATQQKLPGILCSTFEETIRPELIAVLRDCLPSRSADDLCMVRDAVIAKLSEHYELISSDMEEIKHQLTRPEIIQQHIRSGLQNQTGINRPNTLPSVQSPNPVTDEISTEDLDHKLHQMTVTPTTRIKRESLSEVYYLVFLYLGNFLKNLFLVLSSIVLPYRALMLTLLAKYNIFFLDAIGRPPRILPFEYFRSFKILKAFIEQEFRDLPGSTWVNRGRYIILNLRNNKALGDDNWYSWVAPGAKIAMSILVRKQHGYVPELQDPTEERCPDSSCSGRWKRSRSESWATCPICQKEVYTCLVGLYSTAEQAPENTTMRNHGSEGRLLDPLPEFEDEDVSVFKRIAEERFDFAGRKSGQFSQSFQNLAILPPAPYSFRPSKYEWEAAADWQEPVIFQTSTFKNSHFNTAHYNNPHFQPEEWMPDFH